MAVALLALALAQTPKPAFAETFAAWDRPIAEASARFGIPVAWIRRVIRAESGGRTMRAGSPITSRVGAMGLMQVMPRTWLEMRARHGLGPDPHDPRDNILAGTAYLRAMYDRFGYPGLFGAYNAGPARYANHLANGTSLPTETIAYMATIAGKTTQLSTEWPAAHSRPRPLPDIFFELASRDPSAAVVPDTPKAAAGTLFVVHSGR